MKDLEGKIPTVTGGSSGVGKAVAGEITLDRLWHAVPAFPTVSEVWLHLLEAYGL
jgi:NAD(P)-dependent dehydrogenase (short-subunit alcohol dehydrogenase family)